MPRNLRVPPQGSSTEGESGPKIRPKGVVDGQQVNIPVLPLVGPEERRRLAHIDGKVWHLDVGSSPPGAVVGSKGWAVRPLKRYVSWVQNVVRQFGPYPVGALEH
ncbi:hypothetical protein RIF29_43274 [Crotalaria pallida]|uniref:Uncharacterized protein n=1 Tax=Crotalaria pallida TaxID=3830 RepID=A0AAN9HKE9_CROPI